MGVIFVGSTVDRETLKKLSDASVAGNKMELGFVKGFINNNVHSVAISVEAYGMWMFNDKPIVVKSKLLQDENAHIITVPYINVPVIKQITIMMNIKKAIHEVMRNDEYRDATIIVYNTMTIFSKPVLDVAHKKSMKCLAVIADLPIRCKKNIFRRIEDRRQISVISSFEGIIPLTMHIPKDFAPNTKYCVVEAGCNPEDYINSPKSDRTGREYKVVFSGTLNELSGIEDLIQSFVNIENENIKLEIYGDGPFREKVQQQTETLKNVRYLGKVTNDEMLRIQSEADLLVCPRKKDDFTTKYTFPSKVLEYICSGVPVLANHLPGIPDEYENYINYVEDETPQSWSKSITQILLVNNEFYRDKAVNAKKVVLNKKSWNVQCKRVIEHFGIT